MKNITDNAGLAPAADTLRGHFRLGLTKVDVGQIYNTSGAYQTAHPADVAKAITRHALGFWGDLGPEDASLQNAALRGGAGASGRFMSVWTTELRWNGHDGTTFWIITEGEGAERRTTILLPEEY